MYKFISILRSTLSLVFFHLGVALCLPTPAISSDLEYGFESAYNAAKLHDPILRKAFQTFKAEQEEDNLSAAALLPDIRVSASYQYEDSDNIYTDENSSYYQSNLERSGGELDDKIYRITLKQPLFDYAAYKSYKRDKALVTAAGYRYKRAEHELIYRVSEQYLKVLLAAQQVFLNEQKLNALNLKQVQAKRANELGVGDQLSSLRITASRDLAHSDLVQAKSQLKDHQTLLFNLTGKKIKFPHHWVTFSDYINPTLLSGAREEWLNNTDGNLSIKEAKFIIKQDELNLAARKGEYLPTINLNLTYYDRTSDDSFRSRVDNIASIELNMPIYSGGRRQSNIRKARARLLASRADLDYIKAEKEQQIELSYNRLASYRERLTALAQSHASSKSYLEAAERQQALQLSDQVTILDARTQLVDTQLQFAETLNQYLLADLTLRLETGKLSIDRLREYDNLFDNAKAAQLR